MSDNNDDHPIYITLDPLEKEGLDKPQILLLNTDNMDTCPKDHSNYYRLTLTPCNHKFGPVQQPRLFTDTKYYEHPLTNYAPEHKVAWYDIMCSHCKTVILCGIEF
jgi:hypothetical protein